MTRSPNRQLGKPLRKAQFPTSAVDVSGVRDQAGEVQVSSALPDLEQRLAHELVQGLVRSATARGADPVARLQEFRTLQQAAAAMSQDSVVTRTAEQLVRATDLALQELLTRRSRQ
jgi:hypothetical protein